MKRLLPLILFVLLAACARAPQGSLLEEIDPTHMTIYHNGAVITMEGGKPPAEAIASWEVEVDPWLYRAQVGFRLQWLGIQK